MKKSTLAVLILFSVILLCCAACGKSDPTEAAGLSALKIAQAPAKTTYAAGESFDKTGMIVMGVYSDGTETEITAYTVDKTVLAEGDTAVTVRYKGLSAAQSITVSAGAPLSSGGVPSHTARYSRRKSGECNCFCSRCWAWASRAAQSRPLVPLSSRFTGRNT